MMQGKIYKTQWGMFVFCISHAVCSLTVASGFAESAVLGATPKGVHCNRPLIAL